MSSPTNVISIADRRVRIKPVDPFLDKSVCRHRNTVMDDAGHVVRCEDCGAWLSAYYVLREMLLEIRRERERLKENRASLNAEKNAALVSRAAKSLDKAWRSKTEVPCCPHCHRAILPEEGLRMPTTDKELELARRKRNGHD